MASSGGGLPQLRRQLKEWERSFEMANGRRPEQSDMLSAEPSIKNLYTNYASLKRQAGKENVAPSEEFSSIEPEKSRDLNEASHSKNKRKIEHEDTPDAKRPKDASTINISSQMGSSDHADVEFADEERPTSILPEGFTIRIEKCGQRPETTGWSSSSFRSSLGRKEVVTEPPPKEADVALEVFGENQAKPEEPPMEKDSKRRNKKAPLPKKASAPKKSTGNFVKLNINGKGSKRKFLNRRGRSGYGRKRR